MEQHERWMRVALEEAELARGTTGNNPWVGCVIVSPQGELLGRGHTLGPGEDHAEVAAARDAQARGYDVVGATLYSTLEPCSFHGRTPACSRAIAERGVASVVIGMRDPHPRVDGEGIRILREAGVTVIEGVCETEVRRQLGLWVLEQHPGDARRRTHDLSQAERTTRLTEIYGVERARIETLLAAPAGPTLETERLLLRWFTFDDLDAFNELGTNPQIIRYVGNRPFASLDVAKQILAAAPLQDYATHGYGRFACVWKQTGQVIGVCGPKFLPDTGDVDLGYRFFPKFWGIGLATESALASLDYARRQLGLPRIVAWVHPDNVASSRVLTKLGFTFDRKTTISDTPGIDFDLYAKRME